MSKKILEGKYLWGMAFVLFVVACGVKGYFLAKYHYHILLADEALTAYNRAEMFQVQALMGRLFLACDYTLGSCRPFFTNLLYILTFKGFGYQPQTVMIMGILVGSLLVPLCFLAVNALINVEVALVASLILSWMTNYVYQSIALTTIIPGMLFIVGALLAAVRYHRGGDGRYLYLSGGLMSLSVFCRYENALLLPVFVGYECFFDQKIRFTTKFVYGLLCASSSLFILCCNYRLSGDPFNIIRLQIAVALQCRNALPVSMPKAFETLWELLLRLLSSWYWVAAVAGMILMIKRYKFRAVWLFLGVLALPLFLTYKIKAGTLDANENYFFLLVLLALPLGLECVRALCAGLGRRRIYGVLALGGVMMFSIIPFHRANGLLSSVDSSLYYSHELMQLTEALKAIPANTVLYIDNVLNRPGFYTQEVLAYLGRNPQKYVSGVGGNVPREKEYYLLTSEDSMGKTPRRKAVKVRDYRAYGYDGLALYRVTRS